MPPTGLGIRCGIRKFGCGLLFTLIGKQQPDHNNPLPTIRKVRFVTDNIGAKVLVVNPLPPELEGFYKRLGFRLIADTGMMAAKL